MRITERLPWYDEYLLILEGRNTAEKDIEDLENPEKQLQRVKKFFTNLGADTAKNKWIGQAEAELSVRNEAGGNSRLEGLKRDVRFANALEDAIQKQDDASIGLLQKFKEDEQYRQLIRNVMFYIGVSKAKTETEYIQKAYDGIAKEYAPEEVARFTEEGVYYYVYYFQCLQTLLKRKKNADDYESIRAQIGDRCMNAKLMMNRYRDDLYLEESVNLILPEISRTEALLNEDGGI